MQKRTYALKDFSRIVIAREVLQRQLGMWDRSTYVAYAIRLEGRKTPIEIEVTTDYERARRQCEELAALCGYGLEDRSTGKDVITIPEESDRCVRERRDTRESPAWQAAPPRSMESRVEISVEGVTVDIPPLGVDRAAVIVIALGVLMGCFPLFFLSDWMGGFDWGDAFGALMMLAWLSLILFVTVVSPIWHGLKRQRATATPGELRLEESLFFVRRHVTISAREIEEIEVIGGVVHV